MRPKLSYCIFFSPRTGSTVLCKGLELTGIAGIPHENFACLEDDETHKEYTSMQLGLWKQCSTPNGVLGIKHPLHQHYYQDLLKKIRQARNLDTDSNDELDVWSDLFPNCKFLFLTRRNRIRQAVSWWKAIQDNEWHLQKGHERKQPDSFYSSKYNFRALFTLLTEISLREARIQAFLSHYQIQPKTIVYEDMVADFEGTIRSILDFLELDHSGTHIAPFQFEKTANTHSEVWVERFREDLQRGKEQRVW